MNNQTYQKQCEACFGTGKIESRSDDGSSEWVQCVICNGQGFTYEAEDYTDSERFV